MSIQVRFYNFNKRTNSTKVPTGSGTDYNCVLKDDTSILEPVIRLQTSNNVKGYNYAYISDFSRYYFVTDIVSSKGFWEISLKVDPMASEKSGIGALSAYVLRSSSSYDEYICDTAYVSKVKETGLRQSGTVAGSAIDTDPFAWGNGHHSYCVGIIGNGGDSTYQFGSVVYYMLNDVEMQSLINYMMSDPSQWSGISTSEYDMGVQRALLNPSQFISSVIVLPFDKVGSQTGGHITFGYYDYLVGGDVRALTHGTCINIQGWTCDIPKHPQAAARGKYMNGAPFTRYTLHFGPFGDISLDPAALIDDTTLSVNVRTDLTSGFSRLVVTGGQNTNVVLAQVTAQVGVPINISAYYPDTFADTMNTVGMVGGIVGNGLSLNFGSMIESAVNGVADGVQLLYPDVQGGGPSGSLITFHDDWNCYLNAKFMTQVDNNVPDFGRPLCQIKQLNTLSGFVLCSGADYGGAGTAQERDEINGYLNGGFFYE